jgi:CheY-like chemotaxis protein
MDESNPGAGKHILVVDDDASVRGGLSRLLRASGFLVTCAAGGEAALFRLGESTPDLVLLDLSMPQIDGLEVLRRIRADARTADVPVVMLSATSDAAMRDRALNGGANDFLPKIGIDYAATRRTCC